MKKTFLTILCIVLAVSLAFPVMGTGRAAALPDGDAKGAPGVTDPLDASGTVDPLGTKEPLDVSDPADPNDSTDSNDPSDPTGPTGPTDPTVPTGPVRPEPPEAPEIISTASASLVCEGKILVCWRSVDCAGYQLIYAPDRSFKTNAVTITITDPAATKYTMTSLTKGQSYYIKARAFRTYREKGKTIRLYGSWSKYKVRIAHQHEYMDKGVIPATCTEWSKTVMVCKNRECQAVVLKRGSDPAKGHAVMQGNENNTWYCEECGLALKYFKAGGVTYVAPLDAKKSKVDVFVTNTKGKQYHYKIYEQDDRSIFPTYKAFIDSHGCAVCSLTSALNANVSSLADYTPDKVISVCEKKVFGTTRFNKNYKKSCKNQRPVSVHGMSKIFKHYGVRCKYVYRFSEAAAVKQITNHLKKGEPVVFTLRGRSNSKSRYVGSVHSMIMLCLDNKGRVVVGDSVNRSSKWGNAGRLKYGGTVKELVHYMRSNGMSSSVYWNGSKGNACYVLVNP